MVGLHAPVTAGRFAGFPIIHSLANTAKQMASLKSSGMPNLLTGSMSGPFKVIEKSDEIANFINESELFI